MPLIDQRLALAGKYLPVRIRGETYGIRCDRIRGQAGLNEMLTRPDLSEMVAGFITRRGRLIPVLDLHHALAGGSVPPIAITILLVQSYSADHPGLPVGLCVDAVGEAVEIGGHDIQVRANYRHGEDGMPCLAKVCGRLGALLDLDAIVAQSIFRSAASPAR